MSPPAVRAEAALDSLVWHALTTTHARFADGDGPARRFQPDVAPFAGVAEDTPTAWDALAALVGPGGWALLSGDVATPPAHWRHRVLGGHQMVLPGLGPAPVIDADIVPLDGDDVPAMLELVELTEPGPFRARTIELGGYVGVKDRDGVLLAMAGRRLGVPGFVEISAVCTRPDARGRGLAAALSHRVAAGIAAEGATPLLHVADTNHAARRVYERLGFRVRRDVPFVIARAPTP